MNRQIIEILRQVRAKITDDSDLGWTRFTSADQLRREIDGFIFGLEQGDHSVLSHISTHFLPTSTFQEHSIQNNWADEYDRLAGEFERLSRGG